MKGPPQRRQPVRIAILSDVHSNFEALTAVFEHCKLLGIDEYVCLGDVVGYGADPNPCCELLRKTASVTLMGNHDAAVIGVMDTDYYYDAAREVLYWTRDMLTPDNFRWLYSLPYTHHLDNLGFFHAAPILPSGFYYVVTKSDADKHLRVYERLYEFNFVGHSHLTNTYAMSATRVTDATFKAVKAKGDQKWIINVGSVGQPRDRDNRACFGVFDTEAQSFEHLRVEYDIDKTARKIIRAGHNEKFAKRLYLGV
jgi:diadenosine tetraphosphatase ApaH/serine/threonine PP2A family protein phosphatase